MLQGLVRVEEMRPSLGDISLLSNATRQCGILALYPDLQQSRSKRFQVFGSPTVCADHDWVPRVMVVV